MTRFTTGLIVLAALAALWNVAAHAQRDPQAEKAMAAAWQKATVEGDAKEAIKLYGAIVSRYAKKDPATAAMALVRMADLHRAMGAADARRLYQRVVQEFGAEKEAVALARAQLGDAPPEGPRWHTVWTQPGTPRMHRLSRDGRLLSYNRRGLFVRDLNTNTDRTIAAQAGGFSSMFSPDGRRIAFVHDNALRIANVSDTPNPQPLYENRNSESLFLHDWSPDGRFIALANLRSDSTEEILLVSTSDGRSRVLKTVTARGDWRAREMYFSPDSRFLAYDRQRSSTDSSRDIFVLPVDGGDEWPAVERGESHDWLVGWSPDGQWLLFTNDRSGALVLWSIAWANGRTQGAPQRLAGVPDSFRPLGWGPGRALYYQTQFGGGTATTQIRLASVDPASARYVTLALPKRDPREMGADPRWSRDGRTLAYRSTVRDRLGYPRSVLMLRSMDTGRIREVKPEGVELDFIAGWAPDGKSVFIEGRPHRQEHTDQRGLFRVEIESGTTTSAVRYAPDQFLSVRIEAWLPDGLSFLTSFPPPGDPGPKGFGIYRVDAQSGVMTPVLLDQALALVDPTLSADARTLYYRRTTPPVKGVYGATAYVERNLTSGIEREVFGHTSFLPELQLSPDGRYIATLVAAGPDRTSPTALRIVSIADGAVRDLLTSNDRLEIPRWSSDSGSLLLWKRTDGTPAQLWRVPLSGEAARLDGELPPSGASIAPGLAFSPDGRHIAYTVTEPAPPPTTEVVAIDNLLPKPARK
jgi:Tol biopolymer transport system component